MIAAISVSSLPAINATLNGISTILLIAAFVLIKRQRYRAHAVVMIAALLSSTLFLAGYLTRKYLGREVTLRELGLTAGWLKWTYYAILFPHVLLAILMLPMILVTVTRASRRRWPQHRSLAGPTYWIWLFVSLSGVVVYVMLYHLIPAYVRSA